MSVLPINPWRLFWAKTDRSGERPAWTRPLWAHLLDVAAAAETLAAHAPAAVRHDLADALGLDESDARRVLALLVGLHDVGKAIPSFQFYQLDAPYLTPLKARGLSVLEPDHKRDERIHHGHASIPILRRWIARTPEAAPFGRLLPVLGAFVGFHHGRLCEMKEWDTTTKIGGAAWEPHQQRLLDEVSAAWLGETGWPQPRSAGHAPSYPPALLAFAGWTTLADWVGSMAEEMPKGVKNSDDLDDYLVRARAAAARAVERVGLDLGAAFRPVSFEASFPEVFDGHPERTPRPLQTTVAALTPPAEPALYIIEAPTGEGKTEAAFYLAARLQRRRADAGRPARGVYVAMPTQATSNGLFPRFERFLRHTHEAETAAEANLRLVHGADALNVDQQRLLDTPAALEEVVDEGDRAARVRTLRWFARRKRSLLAPYGVGTVDQAFLAVLYARHFFLRLYGLAGKTVVFDEVHAYDGYMGYLFLRLLAWLRALGADVIVLSATLPGRLRTDMLKAWGSEAVAESDRSEYPALTEARPSAPGHVHPFDADPERRVELTVEVADADLDAVAERVAEAVDAGATVAIVVNLVARAQRLYQLLEGRLGLPPGDLVLFHARYPFAERRRREHAVVGTTGDDGEAVPGRFGPGRPDRPGVLVATQVAEQSLDLDVDLMLSDLAPVDLLLQRAGRLHRHERPRPPGFETPTLVVLQPDGPTPGLPPTQRIGGGNRDAVYLDFPLFRTARLLTDAPVTWMLPDAYRDLVEAVYDVEGASPAGLTRSDRERWKVACNEAGKVERLYETEAGKRIVPAPEKLKNLVKSADARLRAARDEDDASLHEDQRALTRLGGPSVEVTCFHRDPERPDLLFLDADFEREAPLGRALDHDEAVALLEASVRLSNKTLAGHLLRQERSPDVPGWDATARETPALFFHRPLVFERGRCRDVPGLEIELHPDLGIVYHR